jgi:hypothetical protein
MREKDARVGTYQDVAQREGEIKIKAGALRVGMSLDEVLSAMGTPTYVSLFVPKSNESATKIKIEPPPGRLGNYTNQAVSVMLEYTPYDPSEYNQRHDMFMSGMVARGRTRAYDTLSMYFGDSLHLKDFGFQE